MRANLDLDMKDANKRILFIPGKNPKPPRPDHEHQLRRCLAEGMRRAERNVWARRVEEDQGLFALVGWNPLFYGRSRDIGPDLPRIDALLRKRGADETDRREARSWSRRLAWFLYHLADSLPPLIRLLPYPSVRENIIETNRYFGNLGGVAARIREMVKQEIRRCLDNGCELMIIGHSMGSIIAYDSLWELSRVDEYAGKVSLFLTLGSPLGMRFVQKRLQGARVVGPSRYPANIRRWVNIASEGDLNALDPRLRGDFRGMLEYGLVDEIDDRDHRIYTSFRDQNGLNVHRCYGYMVHPEVAATVADWLAG